MKNLEEFEYLIDNLGARKEKARQLDKECKADVNKLKKIMLEDDLKSLNGSEYVAKLSVYNVDNLDEDKLFNLCHGNFELQKTIKTKEYVDMDELERVLYEGNIPESLKAELATCYVPEERTRLTINKKKGDK